MACSSHTGRVEFSKKDLNVPDCVAIAHAANRCDYQTVDVIFDECNLSSEGAVAFLRQVGDHPLSLTLK